MREVKQKYTPEALCCVFNLLYYDNIETDLDVENLLRTLSINEITRAYLKCRHHNKMIKDPYADGLYRDIIKPHDNQLKRLFEILSKWSDTCLIEYKKNDVGLLRGFIGNCEIEL